MTSETEMSTHDMVSPFINIEDDPEELSPFAKRVVGRLRQENERLRAEVETLIERLKAREAELVDALRHTDQRFGESLRGTPIRDAGEVRERNRILLAQTPEGP